MTWRLRPRAKPWVINYFPWCKSDPHLKDYPDYYHVRLMLHHPSVDWDDLLSVDGQVYATYVDAFRACIRQHIHLEDFYTDVEVLGELVSDSDPLADFEILARRRPRDNFPHVDTSEGLSYWDMDRNFDWSMFFAQYNHPPGIFDRLKAENSIVQLVTTTSSPESLNTEQQKLYDVVVDQYTRELVIDQPDPPQLLLQVDGAGGVGKTVALLRACARLQELAVANGKQSPVFWSAPTGIAAYAITGKTLHSLLRLPVRGKMSDLSTATLQSLQALFRDCHFLMVDKKSMIDLKMFSLVDDRLRAIFPATSDRPFGGINVLICGDFFQLPPVGRKPLYAGRSSNVNKIKGCQLYQAFDKTIRLTEIIRQQGDDPVSIWFRQTLGELRENRLT
jgi:ATP-dependent DNA helicase PIF1